MAARSCRPRAAEAPSGPPAAAHHLPRLALAAALVFLLADLALRLHALAVGAPGHALLAATGTLAASVALLMRPWLMGSALEVFGATFLLYGFHSYRLQSQAFELVVSALGVVLCLRLASRANGLDLCPVRA